MREKGKGLAVLGVCLQSLTVATTVMMVVAMLSAFAVLNSGDSSSEETQTALARAISHALYAQAAGLVLSVLGAVLMGVALCVQKYRAKWFQIVLWIMSVIWLINVPFGTAVGIVMMVYLSTHAAEFDEKTEDVTNEK